MLISIHAPVKGATRRRICQYPLQRGISIHAPVKGATVYGISGVDFLNLFQSTHP